ncbi:MAG: spermidine/putrescine ABC transporter permease [Rhodospirillales bacterium 70-18]|nr:ABC transporter permease subunit [Rhodospirillales bacterium]OJY65911.1 MAG: spermidine/putrescine ABC transporter permease [Rhodospirillales bacterium 70-18]
MSARLGPVAVLAIVLGIVFFLTPLIVTFAFSLWEGGDRYGFAAYRSLVGDPDLWASLLLSLRLAAETMLLGMVLLVPSMIFVHLKAPGLKPLFEFIAALPFVVPAIALVAGLSALYTGPAWLIGTPNYLVIPYFFLALPYAYRAIDVGLSAIDVRTLTDAAHSLGAGWGQVFRLVLLPNLSTALLGATLLTLTIVMGEFTFASVLLFKTFAVYINDTGSSKVTEAAALSLLSFVITWAAMLGVLLTGRNTTDLGGTH